MMTFEDMVAYERLVILAELKTLEAVVGEISEKRWQAILKALVKRPHLSVGEVYMDFTHD